ncbi:MAG TPA: adenosylcobalamin-dependent ribonucleoside-diphosphate reductase [Geobacterales bacterium]|nr:adenosylcobalamin-dependent ribonucleoside-diphosphate reductase [Geobacterales bacterium]
MVKPISIALSKELEELSNKMFRMFENPEEKIVSILGKDRIEVFRKVYFAMLDLLKNGSLPIHPDYLSGNELAQAIYEKKYFLKDLEGNLIEKRPEHLFLRVASFIASAETNFENALKFAKLFYFIMYEGYFMPAGRVLAGAGDLYRTKTLANCFVSMIQDDSIEAIYNAAYEAARTYSYGGGIGIDISCLRPRGARIHNAAITSTGSVSFMELYSLTTGLIGQEGRRGALMLTIDVKHPDVFDFIKCKQVPNWVTSQIVDQLKMTNLFNEKQLAEIERQVRENTQVRFANISIKASNEFMRAVEEQITYGANKILVYKKKVKGKVNRLDNIKDVHYSYGIPSKDINNYALLKVFDKIEELNEFLAIECNLQINEADLKNPYKRDVYGDFVIELPNKDYDLAIRYSGDFLLYFSSDKTGEMRRLIKAREIWNMFIESNYKTAEPGIMFWDRMKYYSPSDYAGFPIVTTNPCAEVPLEDGGACNLGSINLSRFVDEPFSSFAKINLKKLKRAVKIAIRFMDNVIEWNILLHPLPKQREASKNTRRIGLGVMGIADMFYELGIDYDSPEALRILDRVMYVIANSAYYTSAILAKEKGKLNINYERYLENPYIKEAISDKIREKIRKYGIRNIALLSIAPTGTISNIVKSFEYEGKNYIGVSGGIEPVFDMYYLRRTESFSRNVLFKVFHSTIQAYIDIKKLNNAVQDAKDVNELKKILPPFFFKTAHVLDVYKRIEIQAIAQRYVDHSISSTINLPEDIHPETLSKIYFYAWKAGLKSVTIYREGSRFPILSRVKEKSKFEEYKDKFFEIKVGDKTMVAKGDEVIELPDGTLSTPYHILQSRGLIQ